MKLLIWMYQINEFDNDTLFTPQKVLGGDSMYSWSALRFSEVGQQYHLFTMKQSQEWGHPEKGKNPS